MPTAVLHILVPIFLIGLFRHFYIQKYGAEKFPIDYVFFAGIAGIIPDLDIIFFWIGSIFDLSYVTFHGGLMHSFFFLPAIFLIFAVIVNKRTKLKIKSHKINLKHLLIILAFGSFVHIFLDILFHGGKLAFWPFFIQRTGLDFLSLFDENVRDWILPTVEGILLVIWLFWLYLENKVRNFV